jgi:hypothetical protein
MSTRSPSSPLSPFPVPSITTLQIKTNTLTNSHKELSISHKKPSDNVDFLPLAGSKQIERYMFQKTQISSLQDDVAQLENTVAGLILSLKKYYKMVGLLSRKNKGIKVTFYLVAFGKNNRSKESYQE